MALFLSLSPLLYMILLDHKVVQHFLGGLPGGGCSLNYISANYVGKLAQKRQGQEGEI